MAKEKTENQKKAHEKQKRAYNDLNISDSKADVLIELNKRLDKLKPFSLYTCTVDEMIERVQEFFETYYKLKLKPTVSGLAYFLGTNRQFLQRVSCGLATGGTNIPGHTRVPKEIVEIMRNVYMRMEMLWETYMQEGCINVVAGIFLSKNNFGYKNNQETLVQVEQKRADEYNIDEIKERYIVDSTSKEVPIPKEIQEKEE